MNNLDQPLSEKEETQQSVTLMQIMHQYSHTFEESAQTEEPKLLPFSTHFKEEPDKVTQLTGSPWSQLNSNIENITPLQHEKQINTSSSVSPEESPVLPALNYTREHVAKEPLKDNQYTNKIIVNEEHQASLIPLSICSVDVASGYNVIKEKNNDSLAPSSIDQMQSSKTTLDSDVFKGAEIMTRSHPVPAPRAKKPTSSILNNGPPKVFGSKPVEVEKETAPSLGLAESSKENDKAPRPSSFRFNIGSAKYRSKTSDENVPKQDEESSGNTQKGYAYTQNPVEQVERVENAKSTEVCRNTPSAPDKRSCLWKEVIAQNVSKTGIGDNLEKSEGCPRNTEYPKTEKAEKSEDRRGLFGVKLRSTSLCLKYRSELPRAEAEVKRHSLEGHLILGEKEPVSSGMEAARNDKKANVQTNPATPTLDSQLDPTLDQGRL